eukprot:8411341-Alexandrium_andersonii.AAC.1
MALGPPSSPMPLASALRSLAATCFCPRARERSASCRCSIAPGRAGGFATSILGWLAGPPAKPLQE